MKRKLSHLEKVKREIMKDIRLKRMPRSDNKQRPIFHTCGICKKRPVTIHHFLCNKCWKEKNNKEKLKEENKQWKKN